MADELLTPTNDPRPLPSRAGAALSYTARQLPLKTCLSAGNLGYPIPVFPSKTRETVHKEENAMNRTFRLVSATALAVALGAGVTATAVAAPAAAPAAPSAASSSVAAKPALTAKADVASVDAWQNFHVTGKASGIAAGTKVTLQQKQGAKWVSLPATVSVNSSHTYALRVKLGIKGKNSLRIVGGGAVSPVFTVTVR